MSGSFNTLSGATLFQSNAVTGGANDVEVNNLLVDNDVVIEGDCTVNGILTAVVDVTAAGVEGSVQIRGPTGGLFWDNQLNYNSATNTLTTENLYVPGDAQIGNNSVDTLTVLATTEFSNNVQFGNSNTDNVSYYSTSKYMYGLYKYIPSYTQTAFPASSGVGVTIDEFVLYQNYNVHLYNMKTASTTTRPSLRFFQNTNDVTQLYGACTHSNSTGVSWNNDRIYLWGDTWSSTLELSGVIRFTKMGQGSSGKGIYTISYTLANTAGTSTSTGAGQIVLQGSSQFDPLSISIVTGGGVNFTGGYYNITYGG